jgi:hypothetical protein
VIKSIRDQNPCTRPCVEVHENVHVKDLEPICKSARRCLDRAGDSRQRQDRCLDTFEVEVNTALAKSECQAYAAETECLKKREHSSDCATAAGKLRWTNQMKLVDCYRGCFCSP